ncbi:MAG: hypothetical protein M5U26_15950 [Planctomycetota bacterium]|nr:hypothetical protein [Planctomycetota bacterium]
MKAQLPALLALSFCIACAACAEDVPEQFTLWAAQGPEFPPAEGWTEDPAEPKVRACPEPTAAEKASGFILFQRAPQDEIYHDTVPAPFERCAEVHAFAAQGEYEPLSFALHALEDLKNCRVRLGAWKSSSGDVFPAAHVDVRIVRPIRSAVRYRTEDKRFRWAPFLLEQHETFGVARNHSAQVWLTVHVPESAAPGDYSGVLTAEAEGKAAAEVSVVLRVLPFRLPPVPIETAMSYAGAPPDLARREKEFIDLREHGINNAESGIGAQIVSRDRRFGADDIEATRKSIRENLALRRKVYGEAANRWPATAEVGHQLLYHWNKEKHWFEFWPHSDQLDADFEKAIRTVLDAVKAEGGPRVRLFIMDEPGGHPDVLKETAHYALWARQRFPELGGWCTIGGGIAVGIDEIGILGPAVDEFSINRFTPELCRTLLDRGKPYGVYNGGSSSEAVGEIARDRYFFGFYAWKTGASEILQWVYAFDQPWKNAIRGNFGYVYRTDDGVLPSLAWESVREGLDDYRYTDLLWRLITAARASGDPRAVAAAKEGEAAARRIMSRIDFHYQDKIRAGQPAISATLAQWRWQTASAILDLLKHVTLAKALATDAVRPGPFDLPAPAPEAAPEYGPELIAEGSFESGPGPWKASPNKDAFGGKGGVDGAERHGGAKSFKLDTPAGASGMAVNVCVWGWGPPAVDVNLEAGKTYEFAAWLKVQSGAPQLRLNLPKGAQRSASDRDEPADAAGWKRVVHRVTLAKDAKPSYLAVWLQGAGAVWIDDLSLREVKLPAFRLSTPTPQVDASQRMAVVRVEQDGGAELQVRLSFPGLQPETRSVIVPAGGKVAVEYPAAAWPQGGHEIKAESDGCTATLRVERIRGPFEAR